MYVQDTCYFMAVSLSGYLLLRAHSEQPCCADLLVDWPTRVAGKMFSSGAGLADFPMYLWADRPCSELGAVEVEDAFAALFQYARSVEWSVTPAGDEQVSSSSKGSALLLFGLVTALQLRAGQLLAESVYGLDPCGPGVPTVDNYASCRVLWSCATARLKLMAMATHNWELHTASGHAVAAPTIRTRPATLLAYLAGVIGDWEGPRLREGLAKAWGKRLLRQDEVGRTCAFEGGNTYCRARGSTDVVEDTLHGFDLATLLSPDGDKCVGAFLSLKELLVLKLLHNALEAISACDFMLHHVQLQNMREAHSSRNGPNISMYVHRVMELPGGWVAVPHHAAYYPTVPLALEEAICLWYDSHFAGNDPLDLNKWASESQDESV